MGSLPDLQTAIVVLEVPEIGKGPDCRALALTLQNALKSRKVNGRMEARIQPGATLKLCSILSEPQSFRLGVRQDGKKQNWDDASEAEQNLYKDSEEGRALGCLESLKKTCAKELRKANVTAVECKAFFCQSLERGIVATAQELRPDVIVSNVFVKVSRRGGVLSSINAPPGGLLGIDAQQESFSSRIANKAGCSVYIFHDKKWIEEHIYTGPRLAPVPQTPRSPLSSTLSFSEVESSNEGAPAHHSPPFARSASTGHSWEDRFNPAPPRTSMVYSRPDYRPEVLQAGQSGRVHPHDLRWFVNSSRSGEWLYMPPPGQHYFSRGQPPGGYSPGGTPPAHSREASAPPFYQGEDGSAHFNRSWSTGQYDGSPSSRPGPNWEVEQHMGLRSPHQDQGSGFNPEWFAPRGVGSSRTEHQPATNRDGPLQSEAAAEPTREQLQEMVRQLEAANTVLTQNAAAEAASRAKESRNLYVQYSRQEMETATRGYSEVLGEGGFGVVYKGCLRGTQVAIKKLNPEGLQGSEEFKREVGILSRLRHQNIVILMGCCPEDFCLVYEYCAHGSLEDRLKDEARALPWYTRLRIALEFAKALLYMHKSGVLHSDLKPANLLLDENLTAKLGDFGISQVMPEFRTRTLSHMRTITASGRSRSHSGALRIQGSFGYMDPAIFGGGEFSKASDVYALGICLLQLLTNRPAVNVTRDVLEKYYRKEMGSLVDHRAGEWPAEVIEDLTNIALQSTNSGQSERPDLETEVIPLLERLHTIGKTAEMQDLERMREAAREAERRRGPQAEPTSMKEFVEMHFLCPISQEVMDVPVMAADGHTYERSMIAQWLTHRMTSPVTNQRMAHMDLVENHIVRSAIRQWRESSGGDGEG